MADIVHTAELDARGLKCPLPVLRARKAIKPLAVGEVLKMLATDPAALQDLPAFCKVTGHKLLAQETAKFENESVVVFWIQKA